MKKNNKVKKFETPIFHVMVDVGQLPPHKTREYLNGIHSHLTSTVKDDVRFIVTEMNVKIFRID